MSELTRLGYVRFQSAHIDRWRHFAFAILGFADGTGPDDSALHLRMDETCRTDHRGCQRGRPDRHRRVGGARTTPHSNGSRRPWTMLLRIMTISAKTWSTMSAPGAVK